jgi:hypothetical protein
MEDSTQQQRVQKIFNECIQEEKQNLDDLDKKGSKFTQQVNELQAKLFNYVKKQCPQEYKWIEEHGQIINGPEGLRFKINEDSVKDAKEHLETFAQCAEKHDFGTKSFFNEVNQKQLELQRESEDCLARSMERSEDKTDKDLKEGFKSCFKNTFDQTFRLFNKINSKLEEVTYKI